MKSKFLSGERSPLVKNAGSFVRFTYHYLTASNSVKNKLLFTVVGMTVVFLGILSSVGYYTARTSLLEEINRSTSVMLHSKAEEIDAWLSDKTRVLKTLSQSNKMVKLDPLEMQKTLKGVADANPDFDELMIIFQNGKVYSSNGQAKDAAALMASDWYQDAITDGKEKISNPIQDHGQLIVTTAVPVYNELGQTSGVLAANVKMTRLFALLDAMKLGQTGYSFVTNSRGILLLHPNSNLVLRDNILLRDDIMPTAIGQQVLSGKNGMSYFHRDGADRAVFYAPIASAGWFLGETAPIQEFIQPVTRLLIVFLLIIAISIMIVLMIALRLADAITKPIRSVSRYMGYLAKGDLSHRAEVRSKDEVGQLSFAYNEMVHRLRLIIANITATAEQVNGLSEGIATATQDFTGSAEQVAVIIRDMAHANSDQAGEAQRTLQTLHEMSDSMELVKQSTDRVANSCHQSQQLAGKGMDVMAIQRQCVQQTVQVVEGFKTAMQSLNERIGDIGTFTEVITGISRQTQLLALNAAIEAARAGEHGHSFAVVADEVKKLSDQSQQAARQIAKVIETVTNETAKTVALVLQSDQTIRRQADSVQETCSVLGEITQSIDTISEQVCGIVTATVQSNDGLRQVSCAMEAVTAAVQQSAAGSEQIAASAAEQSRTSEHISLHAQRLMEEAEKLFDQVRNFTSASSDQVFKRQMEIWQNKPEFVKDQLDVAPIVDVGQAVAVIPEDLPSDQQSDQSADTNAWELHQPERTMESLSDGQHTDHAAVVYGYSAKPQPVHSRDDTLLTAAHYQTIKRLRSGSVDEMTARLDKDHD